jgi:selenocysteine-specific elongation factor
MIIGTAGHIDHGKSTLITVLTGRQMDRLVEERRREITIELNFAPLQLDGGRVAGVIDVPGH